MELGSVVRIHPAVPKSKRKKSKPSKELPLGFVDRQEKITVRDFIISNIKEVMIKYGFQYLETRSEYSDSIGKFLPDKDRPDSVFHLRMKINGYL